MINKLETDICIVGGGPCGAMLAMLLARQNIKVVLLERTASNIREFRGESISPDSVAILDELNIMPYIEKHGYLKTKHMQVCERGKRLLDVDFSRFKYNRKYTIDVPQVVLISALLEEANKCSNFTYLPNTKCESLIKKNDVISGITCRRNEELITVESLLVVAADGRYGKLRKFANLPAKIKPLARDVLWFMLPMPDNWGEVAKLCLNRNQHIILLPTYPNTLRVGLNIPSGQYKAFREKDISYLYNIVTNLEPTLANLIKKEIRSWSDTTLLDIFTMEVPKWSIDGFLLIGDAAHTLTPILGQGVNQAIMDSVAVAPIISKAIHNNSDIPLQSHIFNNFVKKRKKEVKFIHKFQIRQEKMLAKSSTIATFIRRLIYRFMNKSYKLQDFVWGKLLYKNQQLHASKIAS